MSWFASYLQNLTQETKFRNQLSEERSVKGRVPEGSKVVSLAFIIDINALPVFVLKDDQDEDDVAMSINDTTISEIFYMSHHISGNAIGNFQRNVNRVFERAE